MIWKYVKAVVPTAPGTLMNVTPLSDVPTIPNATSIQLLFRLPMKKLSLVALREVTHATPISRKKYAMTKKNRRSDDIDQFGVNAVPAFIAARSSACHPH